MPDIPRADLILYGALALVALGFGMRILRPSDPVGGPSGKAPAATIAQPPGGPSGSTGPTAPGGTSSITVHVAGQVRRPGVYEVPRGARVMDAVEQAGGPTRRGDTDALNLAAKVEDGRQILIPLKSRAGTAPARAAPGGPTGQTGPAAGPGAGGQVNINTATLPELDTLPGVGLITAQKIIDYREANGGFATVEDLANVPGIGPKRLDALREAVTT